MSKLKKISKKSKKYFLKTCFSVLLLKIKLRQLARNATIEEIENSPFGAYFMNHGRGVYAANSDGMPFDALAFAVTADPIADLVEDLAAEQKARAVYDNILRISDDPDVNDVIKFLRQREIVHFQRFGEALDRLQNKPKPKMCCGMDTNKKQ